MKNLAAINPEHRLYFRDVIQEIRAAVRGRKAEEAQRLLNMLERQLEERFKDYRSRAQAMADANSRAVEILDRQISLTQELQRENEELKKQQEADDIAKIRLETQGRSAASATAKAVIQLEKAEEAYRRMDDLRVELDAQNRRLKQTAESLKKEAAAVAMANVQAVFLLENKDMAIAELKKEVEAKKPRPKPKAKKPAGAKRVRS